VCVIVSFIGLILSLFASFVGKVEHVILILSQEFNQNFFLIGFRIVIACAIANKGSLGWNNRLKPSGPRMLPIVVIILR